MARNLRDTTEVLARRDSLERHRALLHFTEAQRDTFLCLSRWASELITKRELRKHALADANYKVPKSPQTYSDHLRKFIDLGLLNEDPLDAQVVLITPLGREFRALCIDILRERAIRESAT